MNAAVEIPVMNSTVSMKPISSHYVNPTRIRPSDHFSVHLTVYSDGLPMPVPARNHHLVLGLHQSITMQSSVIPQIPGVPAIQFRIRLHNQSQLLPRRRVQDTGQVLPRNHSGVKRHRCQSVSIKTNIRKAHTWRWS